MLGQWARSRRVLRRGIAECARGGGDPLQARQLAALRSEEQRLGAKIRSRAQRLRREMELEGMTSLRERVRVAVQDEAPPKSRTESEGQEEAESKPEGAFGRQEETGAKPGSSAEKAGADSGPVNACNSLFQSKHVFDFRQHSNDFARLSPALADGRLIAKSAQMAEQCPRPGLAGQRRVQFKPGVLFVPPLKQMLKALRAQGPAKDHSRARAKPILKTAKQRGPVPQKPDKQKLKRILSSSLDGGWSR